MTPAQRRKEQKKAQRIKAKAKRDAAKARERTRIDKRKAKRAAKARPKTRLAMWSKRIHAKGACAVCGTGPIIKIRTKGKNKGKPITIPLNAHHVLPKERYKEFMYMLVCGVLLCPWHHKYSKFSAHRNPIWFAEWMRVHRPRQYAWCLAHMGEWTDEQTPSSRGTLGQV